MIKNKSITSTSTVNTNKTPEKLQITTLTKNEII